MSTDEDALFCDFAETYHIYNLDDLSVFRIATLADGLSENSRIKRKMSGQRLPIDSLLLAVIADKLSALVWMQTKDGQHGRNYPPSIFEALTIDRTAKPQSDIKSYSSGEDFMRARAERMKKQSESEAIEI